MDEKEREIWRGTPDPVLSPMAARTTIYNLTNERVMVRSGSLRKKAESLELLRVKDISVKKSLTQRGRGRGDVRITSTNPSTPHVTFESIEKPEEVAETLRGVVRTARKQSAVVTQERMPVWLGPSERARTSLAACA
jgi:uncharacterized membrane protein YdbT with pleckstrin-like domain